MRRTTEDEKKTGRREALIGSVGEGQAAGASREHQARAFLRPPQGKTEAEKELCRGGKKKNNKNHLRKSHRQTRTARGGELKLGGEPPGSMASRCKGSFPEPAPVCLERTRLGKKKVRKWRLSGRKKKGDRKDRARKVHAGRKGNTQDHKQHQTFPSDCKPRQKKGGRITGELNYALRGNLHQRFSVGKNRKAANKRTKSEGAR